MSITEKRSLPGRYDLAGSLRRLVEKRRPGRDMSLTLERDRDDAAPEDYRLKDASDQDYRWASAMNRQCCKEMVSAQFGIWDEDEQKRRFDEKWNSVGMRIIMRRNVRIGLLYAAHRADCLWIGDIQIASRWRGRGVAKAIVMELLAQARQRSVPVRLRVLQMNVSAKQFYDRLGFEWTHDDVDYVYMQLD